MSALSPPPTSILTRPWRVVGSEKTCITASARCPFNFRRLSQRAGDVHLLFRKFTTDFSEQYRMPPLSLDDEAIEILEHYPWPGNIRQLKNVTEQMSILETNRLN